MVIVDTDLLVGLLRGNEAAIEKLQKIEDNNFKISTTAITSYELFKGVYLSSNPEKNLLQVSRLLQNILVLNFDLDTSKISAKIYSYLKKKGFLTNLMDQIIASIAISKNEILITRNIKHYQKIPNLKIEIW